MLENRNVEDHKYTFLLGAQSFGPDFGICMSGQARGALAAMTLYFISWRTGALIGQSGGSREPLTTGHSRTSLPPCEKY